MLRSGIPACSLQDRSAPTLPDGKSVLVWQISKELRPCRHGSGSLLNGLPSGPLLVVKDIIAGVNDIALVPLDGPL
ncbi:hypothetical protein FH603_5559 [Spirosoma sp. LMG 31447]|uniref:Uncharacterized protein n=1 Tax=Spirosoma utsteinense TaxID=2585773 RepID=A0ABR6WGB9_9BACT|nr:hypothetical protein [Spirosoma utsteinense]